jgi:hypothetical protein
MKMRAAVLLKPTKGILIIYSGLSLLFILAYNFYYSFQWQFVFGIGEYMSGLLILILIALYISTKIDLKYNIQLKGYFKISLMQLVFVWIISKPIRTWQIDSSKEKGREIIDILESYKSSYSTYPESLDELDLDIPRRTNIGTRYWYEKIDNQQYELKFASYYGYWLSYVNDSGEWFYLDD